MNNIRQHSTTFDNIRQRWFLIIFLLGSLPTANFAQLLFEPMERPSGKQQIYEKTYIDKWSENSQILEIQRINLASLAKVAKDGVFKVKLEVFPNPTGSGKVSIQYDVIKSGEYTMELYNSNGIIIQQIFKNKLMEIGQHSIEVPSDNSEGLHYVVLKGQDIIKRIPILIKNS